MLPVDPSHRPRLLVVVSTNLRRGAEVFGGRLGLELESKGWITSLVALVSRDDGNSDVETLTNVGTVQRRFDPRLSVRLRRRVAAVQPDIILANGGATLRYAVAARYGTNSRLAYGAIGEPSYWIRSRTSRVFNRLLLRRADRVLAVSSRTRDQILDLEPTLVDRVVVSYTGVPAEFFALRTSPLQGVLRVLFVGSLTPEKNPLAALRAVAAVGDAELRFVGDGPLRQVVLTESRKLGVEARVEIVGSVADVRPHLQWAELIIQTSVTEGLPGALLEAGAAGLPAVATDVGGTREAVVDGLTGFVVAPGDIAAITLRLQEAAFDRVENRKMGEEARRHVESKFSMERIVSRYDEVLRGMLL